MTDFPVLPVAVPPQTPPPAPQAGPGRRRVALAAVGALTAGGLAAAAVFGVEALATPKTVVGQASPAGSSRPWADLFPNNGFGDGGQSQGGGSASGDEPAGATGSATAAQEVGVVDIDTVLGYQQAEAAGTGMILTPNGEVLTNNHVVDGATKITVTVVSTGAQYTATVVGTDPSDDVAVLQLQHASGLKTVSARTSAAQVGEAVTAVGNAGGTGGTPSAAPGQVTAVGKTITASDEGGGNAEQLTGLIETDANVRAGDSGGPLYDGNGKVIGMDTAASSGRVADGYAIPITKALSIAAQIESGTDTATIHQGYPAFLGISTRDGDGGALVGGVASGTPAETAGLAAGDVITAVDGRTVTSAAGLKTLLGDYSPGQRVTVTWTDSSGAQHSASVTLGTGPAD